MVYDARCRICNDCTIHNQSHRLEIEDLIVRGATLKQLQDKVPCLEVDYNTLKKHRHNHMVGADEALAKLEQKISDVEKEVHNSVPSGVLETTQQTMVLVAKEIDLIQELKDSLKRLNEAITNCEDDRLLPRLVGTKNDTVSLMAKLTGQSKPDVAAVSLDEFMSRVSNS